MSIKKLRRRGLLLDVLSEISDVERQIVVQGSQPWAFVPDRLLDRWHDVFQAGVGLPELGISDDLLSILLDFDFHLEQFVGEMPEVIDDKEYYIRYDEIWRAVRELADWTLTRIAQSSVSEGVEFGLN